MSETSAEETHQPRSRLLPGMARAAVRHGHLVLALGVAAVVGLMILPIPAALLDVLLAFSIAASVLLLMMAVYIPTALSLSTFPSLLLLTTVLRLSLNIASTKQILLHAHAGHIIETFGRLVMGGSVVVGLVVFTIIAIVQFIVISKGAERVAEVGARFSLDAMPGQQMSIEADLRAGLITKEEARRQRSLLQQTSHMHGSMDGAMKFVKGDAIAAIVIAFVNIVAGISIGSLMLGMPIAEAVARYTLLTVGDGMVSQIPSLLTSVAAGVLITRAAGQEGAPRSLAAQIGRQVIAQPMALLAAGVVLVAFALVPGFPTLVFLGLALACGLAGLIALRKARVEPAFDGFGARAAQVDDAAPVETPAASGPALIVVPLLLRLATNLRTRLSPQALQVAVEQERSRLQLELGTPFPLFQVRFDPALADDHWAVDAQELPALAGRLDAAALEAPSPAAEETLARRVAHVVRVRPDAFVGTQEIQGMVKLVQAQLPDLSEELMRAMPAQRVADVLRRLAVEGVSLRYLREVYESLLTWSPREKDTGMLAEYVRIDLGRFICHRLLDEHRCLHAVTLEPALEAQLRDAVQQGPAGTYIALPPELVSHFVAAAEQAVARLPTERPAVLLATSETRRFVRKLLVHRLPQLHVLAYPELPPDTQIRPAGVVALPGAARLRVATE